MVMITLPFWIIFAIFSPALLLLLFVGVQSGIKSPVKSKAAVEQQHISLQRPLGSGQDVG